MLIKGIVTNEFAETVGWYHHYANNLYAVRWLTLDLFKTREELVAWAARLDYILEEVEETLG